jgi:hypothetical protein
MAPDSPASFTPCNDFTPHRFPNPDASAEVITQKLRQTQFPISLRSVQRAIADLGLQKSDLSRVLRSNPAWDLKSHKKAV